jgi:hypothetical protein
MRVGPMMAAESAIQDAELGVIRRDIRMLRIGHGG